MSSNDEWHSYKIWSQNDAISRLIALYWHQHHCLRNAVHNVLNDVSCLHFEKITTMVCRSVLPASTNRLTGIQYSVRTTHRWFSIESWWIKNKFVRKILANLESILTVYTDTFPFYIEIYRLEFSINHPRFNPQLDQMFLFGSSHIVTHVTEP